MLSYRASLAGLLMLLGTVLVVPVGAESSLQAPVSLETEWAFHVGDNPRWSDPQFDDTSWNRLALPSRDFVKDRGWFWLRLKVILDPAQVVDRSLVVGEIMNYDQAWVNGTLVGSTGMAPPNFRSGWGQLRAYAIPDGVLLAGENTIAFGVYFDRENGIHGPLLLENQRDAGVRKMVSDLLKIDFLEMLFALLIFIAGLFLFYFAKRPQEREYLFFGLATFFLSLSLSPQFFEPRALFSILSANQILAYAQMGLILFPPFLALFVRQYLGKLCDWKCLLGYLVVPGLGALALFICQNDRSLIIAIRTPLLVTIPVYLALCIGELVQGLKRDRPRSLGFLVAFIPVGILAIHDLLVFGLGVPWDNVATFVYAMPTLVILFSVRFVKLAVDIQVHNDKLKRLLDEAQIDGLSGLYTRGSFEKMLKLALEHAQRQGQTLVLALVDIDGLKQVNDNYGHTRGDELIRRVAHQLDKSRRRSDLLGRYGGDEFIGLYFSCETTTLSALMDSCLEELAAHPLWVNEAVVYPRFSYGLAGFPGDAVNLKGLLEEADRRLYQMKAKHSAIRDGLEIV